MNQNQFERKYRQRWQAFEQLLALLESGKKADRKGDIDISCFPTEYRRLCNHYSLAQSRHYSPALVDTLHSLVLRGHSLLYRRKQSLFWQGLHFIAHEFPRTLRDSAPLFLLASLLFFGSATAMGLATYHDPAGIYSLMSDEQVSGMEAMYQPQQEHIGRPAARAAASEFAMFGFYIKNNISIGFRTFAGGMLFGLGSVFFLIYNALMLGGIAGHLSHPPFAENFWQFVSGHSAFELTAIAICGTAGLLLGRSLILPGGYRRVDSLRLQAPAALRLVIGAAVMLLCAAFIEAFWSSQRFDPLIKYTVGAILWAALISYFLCTGKRGT